MGKLYLRADPVKLVASSLFAEATKDELKVFLACLTGENGLTEEELCAMTGCSASRLKSAVTLFTEEGIAECSETPFVTKAIEYEHGQLSHYSDITEPTPKKAAEEIKRRDMSALLDECAAIMGKAALNSTEAAKIVGLATTLSLSDEYLTTLLSFLVSKKSYTVTRLVKKAEELTGKGIDSFDALNDYIKDTELPGYFYEYRRVLGIYGRAFSQTEKECYKRWAEEYCYSVEILALAYDVAVMANAGGSLAYVDKVLEGWHTAGCKTVADCEENRKNYREAKEAEKKEHQEKPKRKSKSEAPTPRFGEFDVEEAFKLALSRSYGDDDN